VSEPFGRRIRRSARLCAWAFGATLTAASAFAATDAPPRLGVEAEIGLSRASSSSPLYRFAPDGALVRLDGRARLAGALLDTSLSGQHEAALAGDWRGSVSGRVHHTGSRQARDLEFGQMGTDLALRHPVAGGVAGIGWSWQKLWVAGEDFRRAATWQLDWVRPFDGGSYLMLAFERARQRHGADFTDLDGVVGQLSASGRIEDPGAGLAGIDVQAGWRRESNRRELPELSHRGRFLRVALDRDQGVMRFTGALMVHAARYKAALADGLQPRRERAVAVEFSATADLGDERSVKVHAQWSRNRAQPALFDNVYRQFGVGYLVGW
jgi:hypothetical protein